MKPNIRKILLTEYLTFFFLILGLTLAGLVIILIVINEAIGFAVVLILLSIASIFLMVMRYNYLNTVLEKGIEVEGKVTSSGFDESRGRINFTYTVDNQEYTVGNRVLKNRRTRKMEKDKVITVLVDAENHEKAFIKELYF